MEQTTTEKYARNVSIQLMRNQTLQGGMQAIPSFHPDDSCNNAVRTTAVQDLKGERKFAVICKPWERSVHNCVPFGAKDSLLMWLSVSGTRWHLFKFIEACLLQRILSGTDSSKITFLNN